MSSNIILCTYVLYVQLLGTDDRQKSSASKEPLSQQKIHRKILDKGVPDDVMPGLKNIKARNSKCALTFQKEQQQIG